MGGGPSVEGDGAEGGAAGEAVVGESGRLVEGGEVGHGFVGQGGEGGALEGGGGAGADVAEVALFAGEEVEGGGAGADADEGADGLTEAAVGLDDVVVGFLARVVAPEAPVFEPHRRLRRAPVGGQDPDGAEVRWRGRGRSGHFVQRDRGGVVSRIGSEFLVDVVAGPERWFVCTEQVRNVSPSIAVWVGNDDTKYD